MRRLGCRLVQAGLGVGVFLLQLVHLGCRLDQPGLNVEPLAMLLL